MQELFKDVTGYEGLYQISNLGNVKSYNKTLNGVILTPVYRKGYATVTLSKNKQTKVFSIHRLIAEAFIPNPDNLPEVNHKDGNKLNNSIDNLEWCTHLSNMRHAFKTGLVKRKPLTDKQKTYISIRTRESMNNPVVREKIRLSKIKPKEVV